jgi:protein translocase subunit secA
MKTKRYFKFANDVYATIQKLRACNCKFDDLLELFYSTKSKTTEYAIACIAIEKVKGFLPYIEQIAASCAMTDGNIVEVETGQGKSIIGLLTAIYKAKQNEKVYVVTSNNYLANRDMENSKEVFDLLNITYSCNSPECNSYQKRELYKSDVIYSTISELGFDYLREKLVVNEEDKILKPYDFIIIDEVDSALLDEANTSLILANDEIETNKEIFKNIKLFANLLKSDEYEIKRDEFSVILTEKGYAKAEKAFKLNELNDSESSYTWHLINSYLSAKFLFERDKDYLVKDGNIEIIDKYTGRVLEGRKFQDGLHECLEIKENLEVNEQSVSANSISIQTYINLFTSKCGMSGTVLTDSEEFLNIYNLLTIYIPPHQTNKRNDYGIYLVNTKEEKWNFVKSLINTERPTLIATGSVGDSELISSQIKKKHSLVNAKTPEEEIEAIKNAGKKNALTISTNMLGRGTDIILDNTNDIGGLLVISTEASTSRRIDNQLKGRAGRQGQNGSFIQVISLEDDIFLDLPEMFEPLLKKLKKTSKNNSRFITKSIKRIQKYYESIAYSQRENLFKFSITTFKYKQELYKFREEVLCGNINKEDIENDLFETYDNSWLMRNKETNVYLDTEIQKEISRRNILKCIDAGIETFNFSSDEIRDAIGFVSFESKKPEEEYIKKIDSLYNNIIEGIKLKYFFLT